jgi:hypothetical protein
MSAASASRPRMRLGAVIAIAIAGGFVLWAAIGGCGDGGSSAVPTERQGTEPVAVSASGLSTLTAALPDPVYWVGVRAEHTYELSQTADGNSYVRYLPPGAKAGDARTVLTVGTYPMENAYAATESASKQGDSVAIPAPGDAVAFHAEGSEGNAYVAFPGSDFQIEVYDPTPGHARRLVEQGAVEPVPSNVANDSVSKVNESGLETIASTLGQPIYWARSMPGTTLELTNASQGRIYVRYLPSGVAVGDPGRYLTVGTYPFENAYEATKALSRQEQMVSLTLPGGGIAVYSKAPAANNAYIAEPGVPFQVEVFDPTPGKARMLVTSGQIVPVG